MVQSDWKGDQNGVSPGKESRRTNKNFFATEKNELFKTLFREKLLPIDEDYFTEEEISEIKAVQQEVARGEWVDFWNPPQNLPCLALTSLNSSNSSPTLIPGGNLVTKLTPCTSLSTL